MDRRKFLAGVVSGTSLVAASAVVGPVVLSSLSPLKEASSTEDWRVLGPITQFPPEQVTRAEIPQAAGEQITRLSVYVWRRSPEEIVVYSRSCTDLGCPIKWDPGSLWFYCPCHGGIFDQDGQRRAGPPKRPLWRYANRVRDGVLEIDLRSVPPMV
jgi:Rieske Fe-S protein